MPMKYGKWEVLGSLDEGGQAHLFRVKDSTADEFLRIKSQETDDVFVLKRLKNVARKQLFAQEIRAILTLQHPNILRIVDYDLEGDKPYYVSDYCKRGSLNKVGAEYFRGNIDRTLEVILPVIDGLSAAHNAKIVHRDIKPQNILMRGDGSPVIADFGICYMDADERLTLTLTDDAVGSVNYIAPEMESGQRFGSPTPETDAYSLAKVLYWMLSGGRIFSRETHRVRPLSGILRDLRFEHVEMLLDDVLVEDPSKRMKFTDLAPRLERVRTLVRGDFAPLKTSVAVRCRFCGIGTYETLAKSGPSGTPLYKVGLQDFSNSDLQLLRCTHCGHVEMFEFSNIAAKDWLAK